MQDVIRLKRLDERKEIDRQYEALSVGKRPDRSPNDAGSRMRFIEGTSDGSSKIDGMLR